MSTGALPLLVEECFDLEEQIRLLEQRRDELRAAILAELRSEGLGGIDLARGSVRRQEYRSFKGLRPTQVLPLAEPRGWIDEALSVNGRGLHRLAASEEPLMARLRGMGEETLHESIVVRRAK